jgi:hypothetical protein
MGCSQRLESGAPSSRRGGRTAWLAAAVLLGGLALLGASSAQAGDDFERGFKNELGRIAAHEAVSLGTSLLGGLFYPVSGPHRTYSDYGYRVYRNHERHKHRRHFRHHPKRHRHHVHHQGHHRGSCGYPSYERYESYKRDGYGGYEHYEHSERGYAPRHRVSYYRD